MDIKLAIYRAVQNAGQDTNKIGWNLDSGLSSQGEYTLADLDAAVNYHPSLENWRLTPEQVQAAWDEIEAELTSEE